ncbi:50S ribosomal protein L9 [Alphaproteobacteria bacterium]
MALEVILIEDIAKLGKIGSIVKVKDGFARNYLLRLNKVLRATKKNKEFFEQRRVALEAENQKKILEAQEKASKIAGLELVLVRQVGNDGKLYGSVTSRDVVRALAEFSQCQIGNESIIMTTRIKEVGVYTVQVVLHSEVKVQLNLNITRYVE